MPRLVRNDVALAYEDVGRGGPPVMLVHAWAGNRTWMRYQLEHLRHGHRVISIDLRGFGESDRPAQAYTVAGFADDVAWMAAQLQLERPVLMGHSMGGSVVLEAAARHPGLASAVVILESLVVAPPALVAGFRPLLDAMRTPAFTSALTQFAEGLLGPYLPTPQRTAIIDTMVASPPHVLVSALEDLLDHDSASAAAACKVPTLYVSSGPWYTDVARFKQLCPTLITAQLVGCGHYFPLEVPDQVNPMISRFLETQVRRAGPGSAATGLTPA